MSTHATFNWSVRIYDVCCKQYPRGLWDVRRMCSPFWRYYAVRSEGVELHVPSGMNNGMIRLSPGFDYLVPAGTMFSGQNSQEAEHFFIHFDITGMLPPMIPQGLIDIPRLRDNTEWNSDSVTELAARCRQPYDNDKPQPLTTEVELLALSLLYGVLARCLPCLQAREISQQRMAAIRLIQPALDQIERALATPLHNEELARLCHYSRDHFIVRFREATGYSPVKYILHRRLTAAAKELVFSDSGVETIARAYGFHDRSHFSRAFVRYFGQTPGAFRKNGRG